MPKICLQAGHAGIYIGATGAAGERDWTTKITPMISNKLKAKGCEVYVTDGNGQKDSKVTSTDWDYFLAIHYDADIYNDRGGFVDFPDASVDMVNSKSKALSKALSDHYFSTTNIPSKPNRSNANTKYYYMWSYLTAKTPCVLIECGVGNRKPQDYEVLRNYEFISQTIADGILKGLGISTDKPVAPCDHTQCKKDLDEMRKSRDEWKEKATKAEDKLKKIEEVIHK